MRAYTHTYPHRWMGSQRCINVLRLPPEHAEDTAQSWQVPGTWNEGDCVRGMELEC